MKKRRHSVLSDLSFQGILILLFVAVLFLSLDHAHIASNGIILCITTVMFIATYFSSIRTGFILDIVFVFLLIALTILETVNQGSAIPGNVFFWILWPMAMITAISFHVREHRLLDTENEELLRQIEKYVTIDELTQMNNLLGFERDAAVYMNISRRYQMDMELVLWRLTYQEDLERLLGPEDMKKAISRISDAIKSSLRKEDLIYLVDTNPYIWGTLLFSKPDAARIVIQHVNEGVMAAGLYELTRQKNVSLELSGTVIGYDGSMITPLDLLNKARKKFWLHKYQPEVWEKKESETVSPVKSCQLKGQKVSAGGSGAEFGEVKNSSLKEKQEKMRKSPAARKRSGNRTHPRTCRRRRPTGLRYGLGRKKRVKRMKKRAKRRCAGKRKWVFPFLILWFCLQAVGCGSNRGEAVRPGESGGTDFIAEAITLSHELISCETVYRNTLYYVAQSSDGEAEPNVIYQEIPEKLETEAADGKIPVSLEAGQSIRQIAAEDSKGSVTLHLLIGQVKEEEPKRTGSDTLWVQMGLDGTVLASHAIGALWQDKTAEGQQPTGFAADGEGNVYVSVGDRVYVIDQSGGLSFEVLCQGTVNRLCRNRDGQVYVVYGGRTPALAVIDTKTQKLGKETDLSGLLGAQEFLIGAGAGTEGNLLLVTEKRVCEIEPGGQQLAEKLQWDALHLVTDVSNQVYPLENHRLLWVDKNPGTAKKASLRLIRRKEAGEQETDGEAAGNPSSGDPLQNDAANPQPAAGDRTEGNVTLGTLFNIGTFQQSVYDFNQENPGSQIEVIDYAGGASSYTDEEYQGFINRLNADIVSGNGPDILILPPEFSLGLYAAKGVLEDMNPYIDGDGGLRGELQESILSAYEREGKLFCLPVVYQIETLAGKASQLGEKKSWNLEEMIRFAGNPADGNQIFVIPTKEEVLKLCLKANEDALVDWQQGGGFRRDFFLKMLEFANRFTKEDTYTDGGSMLSEQVTAGQVRLIACSGRMTDVQTYGDWFGEPVTFIGYPSENGSGSLVSSTLAVAISSSCTNKGTAWKFISGLLGEESQEQYLAWSDFFPIRKSTLEQKLEQAKEQSSVEPGAGVAGQVNGQEPASEAEIQTIRDLINKVDKVVSHDSQVVTIVMEEASAYFGGAKSAEEVADIVENRIGIYVDEMR